MDTNFVERIGYPESILVDAMQHPGEIFCEPPYLACAGHVPRHKDMDYQQWSAFLVLRNDGCRVWQQRGWSRVPAAGERFELNIHKSHGVLAKDGAPLVLLFADGDSREAAIQSLDKLIEEMTA